MLHRAWGHVSVQQCFFVINPNWFYAFTCGFLHRAFLHATSQGTSSALLFTHAVFYAPHPHTRILKSLNISLMWLECTVSKSLLGFFYCPLTEFWDLISCHIFRVLDFYASIIIHVSPINVTPFWVYPTEIIFSKLIVVPVTVCSHPSILDLHLSFALAVSSSPPPLQWQPISRL